MLLTEEQDIREQVGGDLWLLIQRFDFRIVEVNRITTLFSNHLQRGSFKLTLADGRVLKARCFPKAEEAENVKHLSQFLDPAHFPRVLASYGRGLLIEWIEGKPLGCQKCKIDIFIKAGTIQGALHNSLLPRELYEQSRSDSHYWQNRLEQKIKYLIEKGFLTESEGKRLLSIARIHSYNNFAIGLAHGDYCLENMILNDEDDLSIIDIETISITAFAYDLARTTCRWRMNTEQRQAYLNSYSKFLNPDDFLRNFSFWIILVLAESTVFFAQGQMMNIKESLSKLQETLQSVNERDLLERYGY